MVMKPSEEFASMVKHTVLVNANYTYLCAVCALCIAYSALLSKCVLSKY